MERAFNVDLGARALETYKVVHRSLVFKANSPSLAVAPFQTREIGVLLSIHELSLHKCAGHFVRGDLQRFVILAADPAAKTSAGGNSCYFQCS